MMIKKGGLSVLGGWAVSLLVMCLGCGGVVSAVSVDVAVATKIITTATSDMTLTERAQTYVTLDERARNATGHLGEILPQAIDAALAEQYEAYNVQHGTVTLLLDKKTVQTFGEYRQTDEYGLTIQQTEDGAVIDDATVGRVEDTWFVLKQEGVDRHNDVNDQLIGTNNCRMRYLHAYGDVQPYVLLYRENNMLAVMSECVYLRPKTTDLYPFTYDTYYKNGGHDDTITLYTRAGSVVRNGLQTYIGAVTPSGPLRVNNTLRIGAGYGCAGGFYGTQIIYDLETNEKRLFGYDGHVDSEISLGISKDGEKVLEAWRLPNNATTSEIDFLDEYMYRMYDRYGNIVIERKLPLGVMLDMSDYHYEEQTLTFSTDRKNYTLYIDQPLRGVVATPLKLTNRVDDEKNDNGTAQCYISYSIRYATDRGQPDTGAMIHWKNDLWTDHHYRLEGRSEYANLRICHDNRDQCYPIDGHNKEGRYFHFGIDAANRDNLNLGKNKLIIEGIDDTGKKVCEKHIVYTGANRAE